MSSILDFYHDKVIGLIRENVRQKSPPEWQNVKDVPYPAAEGWYRVMHAGDSESIEGHTLYDYPDYEGWAYWTPASADEFEDFDGGYKGSWHCTHDEEGEFIFAFAGPINVPAPYRS